MGSADREIGAPFLFVRVGFWRRAYWGFEDYAIMDFLHTDPATGDQFTVSVDDGGGMPSFAERQAAVAQYRAVI